MSCVVDSRSACTASAVAAFGGARFEGFDREQGVDGGRFGLGFREAVARGQRRLLEDADAIDQPVEMLAEPRDCRGRRRATRAGYRAPGRTRPWRVEMAERELLAAGLEMLVRRPRSGSRWDQEAALEPEPAAATGAGGCGMTFTVWVPGRRHATCDQQGAEDRHDGEVSLAGHSIRLERGPQKGNTRAKDSVKPLWLSCLRTASPRG